jgi:hypothetical protein
MKSKKISCFISNPLNLFFILLITGQQNINMTSFFFFLSFQVRTVFGYVSNACCDEVWEGSHAISCKQT